MQNNYWHDEAHWSWSHNRITSEGGRGKKEKKKIIVSYFNFSPISVTLDGNYAYSLRCFRYLSWSY